MNVLRARNFVTSAVAQIDGALRGRNRESGHRIDLARRSEVDRHM